jgi:Domain of unknown function (DUF4168)
LHDESPAISGTNLGLRWKHGAIRRTVSVKISFVRKSASLKGRFLTMKFEYSAIAAAVIGMILPSLGIAAMNGNSAQSTCLYAQASGTTNPSSVDDATLKRTAAAFVKVREISVMAARAIKSTDDLAKKQQLAAESESAKVAAVKKEGMEPQQYDNVLQMVQADSGLQQKFLSYVQEFKRSS